MASRRRNRIERVLVRRRGRRRPPGPSPSRPPGPRRLGSWPVISPELTTTRSWPPPCRSRPPSRREARSRDRHRRAAAARTRDRTHARHRRRGHVAEMVGGRGRRRAARAGHRHVHRPRARGLVAVIWSPSRRPRWWPGSCRSPPPSRRKPVPVIVTAGAAGRRPCGRTHARHRHVGELVGRRGRRRAAGRGHRHVHRARARRARGRICVPRR